MDGIKYAVLRWPVAPYRSPMAVYPILVPARPEPVKSMRRPVSTPAPLQSRKGMIAGT